MENEGDSAADITFDAAASKSIGIRRIEIALDQSQNVYYSEQQITGNVYLDLEEPVSAAGIRLKCKGEAQVYFTDRSAGIRRKFSAFESYLHKETYLVGDGKEKSMINSGVYPFSLTLPENLPCSFEGRYGRVRYSIRALLDVTAIYQLSTNIIPFTVAPILDLNRDPLAPLPISERQCKVYIGQTEPMDMSMSLPVRGFVPGQTIPMQVTLKNTSTVTVKKLRIVFKKVVSYHATVKSRKHKEIVVEIEQPITQDCPTYDISFDVPAVPPTGMNHCKIIDVCYRLKVETCVDVSEWYYRIFQKNLKLRTDIVVGTVPLKNYESSQKPLDVTDPISFYPPSTIDSEEYTDDGASLKNFEKGEMDKTSSALPTYEKSRIYRSSKPDRDDPTGDDGDSDGEVKPYSPMYRVYKFAGSPNNITD
ncbi:hypothetical protein KM043_016374 [Ampulex compressa]|nr:hypothetical protein KM043_016374 [Ampulex compressa]